MSKIIMYWSNIPAKAGYKTVNEWREAELQFSPHHDLVLKSHERLGNDVEIWTHQKVSEFNYKGITIKDAGEIMSHDICFDGLFIDIKVKIFASGFRNQELGIGL